MREEYLEPNNNLNKKDKEFENSLRPSNLNEFYGQHKIVENLKIFIEAANKRKESLDHVLLHGPPGLGKTTLSYIIAQELKSNILTISKREYLNYYKNMPEMHDCSDLSEICVNQIIELIKEKNILDVGCGNGYLLEKIRNYNKKVN